MSLAAYMTIGKVGANEFTCRVCGIENDLLKATASELFKVRFTVAAID